jgi:hypothetical protein
MRFRRVQPHKNVAAVLLQHDNAQPHTNMRTQETITKSDGMLFTLHPYIKDVAPSGFYFFGAVKDAISGKRLGSDDMVFEEEIGCEYRIQTGTRSG